MSILQEPGSVLSIAERIRKAPLRPGRQRHALACIPEMLPALLDPKPPITGAEALRRLREER